MTTNDSVIKAMHWIFDLLMKYVSYEEVNEKKFEKLTA